ncbi:MAG: hypothetical protein AAF871_07085 [Pseudomonadota bacterium]
MDLMSLPLALDLDHDAIRLLSHREDGWNVEAIAELDADDLTQKIKSIRQRAERLAEAAQVTVILPRSQVFYTAFDGAEPDEIGERLQGLTPYRVADLTWDYAIEEGRLLVAAVALETLDEAVVFARSSKFHILGFTSDPPIGLFPRPPVFARTGAAAPAPIAASVPPDRRRAAFSGQRARDYGPRLPRLPLFRGLGQGAKPGAEGEMGPLRRVAKPLAGLFGIGAALIIGAVIWSGREPDPLARSGFAADFAIQPASHVDGMPVPIAGRPNFAPETKTAQRLNRSVPPIAVPIVIGSSGVDAEHAAIDKAARSFERVSAVPALFGVTRLPNGRPARPYQGVTPSFPETLAFAEAGFARETVPARLLDAPRTARAPIVPALREAISPSSGGLALAFPALPSTPKDASDAPLPAVAELRLAAAVGAPRETAFALRLGPPFGVAPDRRAAGPLAVAGTVPRAPRIDIGGGVTPALLSESVRERPAPSANSADTPEITARLARPADPSPRAAISQIPRDGALAPTAPDAEMALAAPQSGPLIPNEDGLSSPDEPTADLPVSPDGSPDLNAVAALPQPLATPSTVNTGDPALAAVRPRPRPVPEPAPVIPDAVIAEALETPEAEEDATVSAEAAPSETDAPEINETILTASLLPRPRPVRSIPEAAPTAGATAARAVVPEPRLPSSVNAARAATIQNGITFQRLNLIGVYGSASDRRALVRLPSGQFVKLKVGDRVDGGRVAKIDSDRLLYQKGSRTLALEMPNT